VIASLEICMQKHREAAEALMAHFYSKNDDKGLELLDDVFEYSFMSLQVMNDAYSALLKGKKDGATLRK